MSIEVCAHVWLKEKSFWGTQFCQLDIIDDGKTLRFRVIKELAKIFRIDSVINEMEDITTNIEDCEKLVPSGVRYMRQSVDEYLLVKKSYIDEIFPETKSMPYKIARDYVKDRI